MAQITQPFVLNAASSGGNGPGPGATSGFAQVDFTNTASPRGANNVVVHPEVFGVAMDNEGNFSGSFGIMANATYRATAKAMNMTCIRSIAGPDHGNAAAFQPFIDAVNAGIYPSSVKMIIGVYPGTDYTGIIQHWEDTSNIKPYCYELGNEDDSAFTNSIGGFIATLNNLSAQYGRTIRAAGPASPGYTIGRQAQSAGCSVITWHQYVYGAGSETISANQACLAQHNPGEQYGNIAASVQNDLGGTQSVMCMDEWGLPTVPAGDNNVQFSQGAAFICSATMQMAASADPTKNPMWATNWTGFGGGGNDPDYRMWDDAGNKWPNYYAMQRLIPRAPGLMVASSASTNVGGIQTWGTKSATTGDFCVIVINSGNSPQSGQVALSHWPLNATGNGNIIMWSYPSNGGMNVPGNVSSITVTAGLTQTISVPALSCVILSTT